MYIRKPYPRLVALAALIAWGGNAAALGLGEMHTRSSLGEPFVAEVEVLTSGKEIADASCFRLHAPQGDAELPWLHKGSLSIRKAPRGAVLEIRSSAPLRDPVLQVGVSVACGHEVQRDYTLFLSPRVRDEVTLPQAAPPSVSSAAPQRRERPRDERALPRQRAQPLAEAGQAPPAWNPPRPSQKPAKRPPMPDRLVLSNGGEVGDPSLRLTTELSSGSDKGEDVEAKRELLRLEYRLLLQMNQQATTQLEAAEKLRNMEATLAELHQRTGDLAGRMQGGGAAGAPAGESGISASPEISSDTAPAAMSPTQGGPRQRPMVESRPDQTLFSEWTFYGALLGVVLGIGGWLGWRQLREWRAKRDHHSIFDEPIPPVVIDPRHPSEDDEFGEVDFHVGHAAATELSQVDLQLDVEEAPPAVAPVPAPKAAPAPHSMADATVDEHFEVNPVMELAEIMLSFGRVKGAAQALQEYIDHNPEEALQPWIRLMDVYRMAGMRDEFDRLAQDLNRHFNVEVQAWSPKQGASLDTPLDFILDGEAESAPAALAKAQSVEDMEHIRNKLIDCWGTQECIDYLNQLLRDNRGGQRSGFTLSVVEEILFLIELLGARKAMEKDSALK